MDFISVQDAAKNWGISERRIQKLCEENRIEGAVKFSRLWLIPRNAQKPSDRRRKELPKIENIIESYGQYVYNLALKLSANPEYADDLTQETFIKAWLHIKELRSPEAIKKWLRIICINEFRMSLRKQQRENNVELKSPFFKTRRFPGGIAVSFLLFHCSRDLHQLKKA